MGRISVAIGIFVAALAVHASGPDMAWAQRTDRTGNRIATLSSQLRDGESYKVRLAAAINLSKIGDPRAIPVFIDALRDREANLRGLAATALGKLVTARTSNQLRGRATQALKRVNKQDKSAFVRKQAGKALAAIAGSGAQEGGRIYVNVGAMAVKPGQAADMKPLMRQTAEKAFASRKSSMTTSWPGGKAPTARDLRGAQAFHVDGTLISLTTQTKGSATLVSCKISMLIATYPKKSMFGFLDGGARVQASSSPSDIQYAKKDCIAAVIEDLIIKKIIPTIEMRTNSKTTTARTKGRR